MELHADDVSLRGIVMITQHSRQKVTEIVVLLYGVRFFIGWCEIVVVYIFLDSLILKEIVQVLRFIFRI